MFIRVLIIIAIVVIAVWLIQMMLLRARGRRLSPRRYARDDLAPMLAFFGAILLALSLVQAARRQVIDAWQWGLALGFVMSGGAAMLMGSAWNPSATEGESAWRAAFRLARRYGMFALIAILGVVLAVRVVGAGLEVFFAGALGVLLIGLALAMFAREARKKIRNS